MGTYIRFCYGTILISEYNRATVLTGELHDSLEDAEEAVKKSGGYVVKALDLKLEDKMTSNTEEAV